MQVIDYARRGNVVRFYLGSDELESWYGDDWDDAPYEHNAGTVYDDFVETTVDCAVPYDALVLEPADNYGAANSPWCKDDMKAGRVPCLVVVPHELDDESYHDEFDHWVCHKDAIKIYMGDAWNSVAPHFTIIK